MVSPADCVKVPIKRTCRMQRMKKGSTVEEGGREGRRDEGRRERGKKGGRDGRNKGGIGRALHMCYSTK